MKKSAAYGCRREKHQEAVVTLFIKLVMKILKIEN